MKRDKKPAGQEVSVDGNIVRSSRRINNSKLMVELPVYVRYVLFSFFLCVCVCCGVFGYVWAYVWSTVSSACACALVYTKFLSQCVWCVCAVCVCVSCMCESIWMFSWWHLFLQCMCSFMLKNKKTPREMHVCMHVQSAKCYCAEINKQTNKNLHCISAVGNTLWMCMCSCKVGWGAWKQNSWLHGELFIGACLLLYRCMHIGSIADYIACCCKVGGGACLHAQVSFAIVER